jgi:hypothetical protein
VIQAGEASASKAEDSVSIKVTHVDDPDPERTTGVFLLRTSESFSLSGSFDSSILREVKPTTGQPCTGDPPIRFGEIGSCGFPSLYHSSSYFPEEFLMLRHDP